LTGDNKVILLAYFSGMCIANYTVNYTVTIKKILEMVTMNHKKDNQHETLIIEITAWLIIVGIFYILAKAII